MLRCLPYVLVGLGLGVGLGVSPLACTSKLAETVAPGAVQVDMPVDADLPVLSDQEEQEAEAAAGGRVVGGGNVIADQSAHTTQNIGDRATTRILAAACAVALVLLLVPSPLDLWLRYRKSTTVTDPKQKRGDFREKAVAR